MFRPWIVLLTASWVLLSLRALQGGAGARRAVGTTLVLAGLLGLPLLPVAARWADLGWAAEAIWWDAAASFLGYALSHDVLALMGWGLLLAIALGNLHLPRRIRRHGVVLPTGDPLHLHIAGLAASVRAPEPVVCLLRSGGGELWHGAFATGIVRPVVVLGDGVLRGLPTEQRDAIVAHELAHVGGYHVLLRLALMSVLLLAATAGGPPASLWEAVPFLLVAVDLSLVLIGPPQELQADRRAAGAVGCAATVAALDKIHGSNQQLEPFAGDLWFYGLAAHPAGSVRRVELGRQGGQVTAADESTQAHARRCRQARRLCLVGYVTAFSAAVVVDGPASLRVSLLVLMCVPMVLRRIVGRSLYRRLRARRQLASAEASMERWTRIVVGFGSWGVFVIGGLRGQLWPLVCGGLGLLFALLWRRGKVRSRRRRNAALQRGDLQEVLREIELEPAGSRSSAAREILALTRAALGAEGDPAAELERIGQDHPRQTSALLNAAVLFLHREPERALACARQAAMRLPSNAIVLGTLARVERHCGLLDAARQHAEQALAAQPAAGEWSAVLSRIELDAGCVEQAEAHLARAVRLAPGHPGTLLAAAWMAVVSRRDDAADYVERLQELHEALPLAFLGPEIRLLADAMELPSAGGRGSSMA